MAKCDLRLAVTMNGGVSLAVYIGGCANELNLLTNNLPNQESRLNKIADMLGYRPIVDVIAGTSAGGINGVALALAQAYRGADLSLMRNMWIQTGSMESMLRRPFEPGPPSILNGEYMLNSIDEALKQIKMSAPGKKAGEPELARDTDISLLVTTTLLNPVSRRHHDSVGTMLYDESHEGVFRFDIDRDIQPDPAMIKKMALAARATAAFPVAFEPAFLPVGTGDERDLHGIAQWADNSDTKDWSRYGVDGGLLANTPTQHTLSAIRSHVPTGQQVRRLLLLIHPHAPVDRDDPAADKPDKPMNLTESLAKQSAAVRSLGSRRYIEAIDEYNAAATRWRDGRSAVLTAYPNWSELAASIRRDPPNGATPQWQIFRASRGRRLAQIIANSDRSSDQWPQRFQRAIDAVNRRINKPRSAGLPWLIPENPPDSIDPTSDWGWGFDLAIGITIHVGVIATTLGAIDDATQQWSSLVARAATARETLITLYSHREANLASMPLGANPQIELLESYATFLHSPFCKFPRQNDTDPFGLCHVGVNGGAGPSVGMAVTKVLTTISGELQGMLREAIVPTKYNYLISELERDEPCECLRRLLVVEIVSYIHSEFGSAENAFPTTTIDLLQVSGQVTDAFITRELTTDTKLAGMKLDRFGGFLKKSWRTNDWIWGRLDTISVISQALITPEGVRRIAADRHGDDAGRASYVIEQLTGFAPAHFTENGSLSKIHGQAKAQVTSILAADSLGETGSKAVSDLVATVLQASVISEEADALLVSIAADEQEGGKSQIGAALAAGDFKANAESDCLASRFEALTMFANSGLGAESMAEQSRTDLFIRTAATALATAATTITSKKSGLNVAKPVTIPVRTVVAVLYWITIGLTSPGRISRFLSALALAAGIGLSAVSLMSGMNPFVSAVAAGVGIGSVIAVLAYATMRTGTIVHSAAILGIYVLLVPLTGYRIDRERRAASSTNSVDVGSGFAGAMTVAAVLVLVVGALVVANINEPRHRIGRRAWLQAWLTPLSCAISATLVALIPIDLTEWRYLARTASWIHAKWDVHWLITTVVGTGIAVILAVVANWLLYVLPDTPQREKAKETALWGLIYAVCYCVFGVGVTSALSTAPETPGNDWLIGVPIAAFIVAAVLGIVTPFAIWWHVRVQNYHAPL